METTKVKHTPGPWHMAQGLYGPSVCGRVQAGVHGGLIAPCICKVTELPGTDWLDNARLIAAAPEMLEALEDAVVPLKAIWSAQTGGSGPDLWPVFEQVKAAIRKAKGE